MADILTYSNIFDRIRVLVKYFDILETRQTGLTATNYPLLYVRNQILVPFEAQDFSNESVNIETAIQATIASYNQLKASLITSMDLLLVDIGKTLQVTNTSNKGTLINELVSAMIRDTVKVVTNIPNMHASDIAAGVYDYQYTSLVDSSVGGQIVAPAAPLDLNVGNGTLIYSFSQVGPTLLSPCETAYPELMHCVCTGNTTNDKETFQLRGAPNLAPAVSGTRGSGNGPLLTVAGGNITNGEFENWTGGVLDDWTAKTGAFGTEFIKEIVEMYKGAACLEIPVELDGEIYSPTLTLVQNRMYALGFWAKRAGAATGNIYIKIKDSADDTQLYTDYITIDVANLTTSYQFFYFVFLVPEKASTTAVISIETDTIETNIIYIDHIQLIQMKQHNGINFAVFAGDTPFGVGDRFGYGGDHLGFEIQVAAAGELQRFFARVYGKQMPITGAGALMADPS